jgi:hypothetical protein
MLHWVFFWGGGGFVKMAGWGWTARKEEEGEEQARDAQKEAGSVTGPKRASPENSSRQGVLLTLRLLKRWHLRGCLHHDASCQGCKYGPLSQPGKPSRGCVPRKRATGTSWMGLQVLDQHPILHAK